MDTTHWTRRDFVARSTLATLGVAGGASLPLNAQQTFRELSVEIQRIYRTAPLRVAHSGLDD